MSLINDALKRASQAKKEPPNLIGGLRPIESSKTSDKRTIIGILVLLVILLVLGGWFFINSQKGTTVVSSNNAGKGIAKTNNFAQTGSTTTTGSNGVSSSSQPEKVAAATPKPLFQVPTTRPGSGGLPFGGPKQEKQESTNTLTTNAPVIKRPVLFPQLKIQGIFYNTSKPSALINGRLVMLGETFGSVKIVEIDRRSVTVELQGERKVYSLGE
jgi:hypothetical protein